MYVFIFIFFNERLIFSLNSISGSDFYVCDFKGHNVVVFSEEGQYLRRIGCENITNFPNGIDISDAGDVLIGDSHGNRFHVAVFSREGNLITEFECPYVKVKIYNYSCKFTSLFYCKGKNKSLFVFYVS